MYWEFDDPAKLGPTMASATAPTPTRIKAIAANLVFISGLPQVLWIAAASK
jgi:hypothetical protein